VLLSFLLFLFIATVNTIHDWFGFLAKGCRTLKVSQSAAVQSAAVELTVNAPQSPESKPYGTACRLDTALHRRRISSESRERDGEALVVRIGSIAVGPLLATTTAKSCFASASCRQSNGSLLDEKSGVPPHVACYDE
jgi:hypothetical protein